MRRSRENRRRQYLVARGASCTVCTAQSWRAFREPEERDLMSPCSRLPIYAIWAASKREAVTIAKQHFEKGERE